MEALSKNQLNKALILLEEIQKNPNKSLLQEAKQVKNKKGETILDLYRDVATRSKSEDITKLGNILDEPDVNMAAAHDIHASLSPFP